MGSAFHETQKRKAGCLKVRAQMDKTTGNIHVHPNGCPRTSDETIEDWIKKLREDLTKIQRAGLAKADPHYSSQASFLADTRGSKFNLDYIGNLNNLEQEVKYIYDLENVNLEHFHGPFTDTPLFRIPRETLPFDLLQTVCDIYRDDYCCFNLAPPASCQISC